MIAVLSVIVVPGALFLALSKNTTRLDPDARAWACKVVGKRRWWKRRGGQTTMRAGGTEQGSDKERQVDEGAGRGRDASVAEGPAGTVPKSRVDRGQARHGEPFPASPARSLISLSPPAQPVLSLTSSLGPLGLVPHADPHTKGKQRCRSPPMQGKLQIPACRVNLDGDCKRRPSQNPRHASRKPTDRHSLTPRPRDAARSQSLQALSAVYEEDEQPGATHALPGMDCTLITKEHLARIEDDWSSWRASRERNSHLRELQLDRRNIVLDSAHPDLAPHIVITPPDSVDAWNNYWASCVNRPGPQDPAYLALLPRSDGLDPRASALLLPASAAEGRGAREATGATTSDDAQSEHRALFPGEPRRVFSKSRFRSMERDMIFLHNVSTSVHLRNLKLAALEAASTAPSFRTRWDAPMSMRRLERPFQWTDEAEPLLTYFNRCLDTTVIDSQTPCTVPHIVIQEPPADEPYVAPCYNHIPPHQDRSYLTIPSPRSHVVYDDEPGVHGDLELAPGDECSSLLVATVEADFEADTATASTWSGSEGPVTPRGAHYELGEAIIEEFEEYVGEDTAEVGLRPAPPLLESLCEAEEADEVTVDVFECLEEEEDLPPFDEWYQSIAGRTASEPVMVAAT